VGGSGRGIGRRRALVARGGGRYYQLQVFRRARIVGEVMAGLRNASDRTPLGQLCSGDEINFDQYWQAATVVRMCVEEDPRRRTLPVLVQEIGKAWRNFCEKTHGN